MQKLFHRQWSDLHYVPDIQIENPLVLIEEAEDAAHVRFLLFFVPFAILVSSTATALLFIAELERVRLRIVIIVLVVMVIFSWDF